MGFTKHIDETDNYSFDFSKVLGDSETLSSPTVEIWSMGDTFVDVTSEFGTLNTKVDGGKVVFTLNPRQASDEQDDLRYQVYCTVGTSTGRTLVDLERLLLDRRTD